MAVPLEPLLLVTGLVLATTGIFIYRVALVGFGAVFGGAGGMLLGSAIGADLTVFVGAIAVGAIAGVLLITTAYKTVVYGSGALSGAAAGAFLAGASLSDPLTLADPLLAVGAIVGLVAAFFLKKVIVLVLSAAWGASLVSIARADFAAADGVDEILDAFLSTELIVVFVVGIGVQIGLWVAAQYYRDGEDEGGFLGSLLRDDTPQ